jgi:uncharacterized protein YjeT (DUF2065 family)
MNPLFLNALALMLIFEGVLPALLPTLWRAAFRRMAHMPDGQVRLMGMGSLLGGLLLLYLATPSA